MSAGRRTGLAALAAIALLTTFAPLIVPYDPGRQFADYPYAPPMRPHVRSADGWHLPFVYPIRAVDRLEREYGADRAVRMPLRWGAHGRLLSVDEGASPWFLLGSDGLGRDVLSRVLLGARLSLGVSAAATLLALLIGATIGAAAGLTRGWRDELLMRGADFVLVLPAIYVVLALRAALPLVLSTREVFAALVLVLGLVGWPAVARGVRAIVAAEGSQEYAEAARAAGAGPWRILQHHLLPAARGFLFVQACVLVPAFVLAEATLSFVGLGFAAPAASWGAMLQDAASVRTLAEAPWLLAPAAAIVATVFAVHLAAATPPEPWLWRDGGH
ncbi:MAG TPA: ABC transporter permease [Vicinamibacterales bacterium]|nr:ABC transporter permease [Vicinamibacterales bacterium]